jgi:hypothetical protein
MGTKIGVLNNFRKSFLEEKKDFFCRPPRGVHRRICEAINKITVA